MYELPGGHIDYGENVIDGLKREIMEEFGMRTNIGDPFAVFTYLNELKGSHSVEIIYFATFIDPLRNIAFNPEDHSEFMWVSEDELHKVFTESKRENDPEIQAVKKGFVLLKGTSPAFG